jgi:hypothetical protein
MQYQQDMTTHNIADTPEKRAISTMFADVPG